jgi:hypothetical protein
MPCSAAKFFAASSAIPAAAVIKSDNLAGPDWLGMLAAIGIVKGKPFTPDASTRTILDQAAKIGYQTSRVIGFEEVVGGLSYMAYPDRHWTNPFADGTPANAM